MSEDDLSPSEVAELLGISADQVIRYVQDALLEGKQYKPHGRWHISRASVEALGAGWSEIEERQPDDEPR